MLGFQRSAHILGVLLSLGLAGAALDATDPVVVGQTFLAESMDPTEGSTAWALTSHGVAEKLFTVSKDGVIAGQVAQSVQKIEELVWEIFLTPGICSLTGLQSRPSTLRNVLRIKTRTIATHNLRWARSQLRLQMMLL